MTLARIDPLLVLRLAVAAVFFIHGGYRLVTGGYEPFGAWLESIGFPLGIAWAWAVTLVEVGASPLLAAGKLVLPIAGYLILQTALGLWLVHAPNGWFVVGAGRNGMEYSALLIVCLACLVLAELRRPQARR
jgi:putative oxidoreductase